jgi:hypothetical protein
MIRRIYLSIASLVLAANVTVGGLMVLSSVTLPVANVTVGSVVLTGAGLALLMTEVACSKDQLVASAEDVLDVVTSTELMKALQAISPPGLAKLESLVPTARDLLSAIKNGDTSSALALINTIFPVIEEIAALLVGVNPAALGILALANIGLHFIINHTKSSAPKMARAVPAVRQALEYGAQPMWGCQYVQDERCTQ